MNKKRTLSALLAISMIPAFCSCGKTDTSSDGGDAIAIEPTSVTTQPDDEDASNESSDSYHSIINGHSPKKTTTTKVTGTKKSTKTTTKSTTSGSSSYTTPSSGNPYSNNNHSSSGNYSGYNNRPSYSGGGNSSGGSSSSGGSVITTNVPITTAVHHIPAPTTHVTTAPPITTQPPVEVPDEEKDFTAVIDLNGIPSFTGSNVAVKGNVVNITAGGNYHLSGFTFGGRICVNAASEENVTLVLDGVDIHSMSGPAILVNSAKNCTIKVCEGTDNSLSDNTKDNINNGVIFSNDTLRFKGSGTLNINAGNAHGIAGSDIVVESGTYNVNAISSGLHAHNDINITGGTLTISGGTQEEKSAIYAESRFSCTGGHVFAAGNAVTAPTSSPNPYIIADLGYTAAAESTVEIYLNGKQIKKFEPYNDFSCLMLITPEITAGKSFYTIINGEKSTVSTIGKGQNKISLK